MYACRKSVIFIILNSSSTNIAMWATYTLPQQNSWNCPLRSTAGKLKMALLTFATRVTLLTARDEQTSKWDLLCSMQIKM